MELIKRYKVVIAIVLAIAVLVIIRTSGTNHFKSDAKRWAEPSVKKSNTISIEQAGMLKGEKLIINLDKDASPVGKITGDVQNIPSDSILSKNHVKAILKHNGPVLLFSSESGLSARIWMILSQLGRTNIYILSKDNDNEVLKYKFRPDSLLR